MMFKNNTYLTLMCLSFLFFQACGSSEENTQLTDLSSEDSTESASIEEEFQLEKLNSQNVRKVLTEFGKKNKENLVILTTKFGDMKIRLYEETPLHRANFLQLVKRGYYEGTVFHRVVKDLIIQGGNLDDPIIKRRKNETGIYEVPAEFNTASFYHKRGAIASPRRDEGNPEKKSDAYEFYIVQGTPLQAAVVQALGQQNGITYSPAQMQMYTQVGGLPHLDGKYTVFGEVIEGLEIIDSIASVKVDKSDDWPFQDVVISMKAVKE